MMMTDTINKEVVIFHTAFSSTFKQETFRCCTNADGTESHTIQLFYPKAYVSRCHPR